MIYIHDAIFGYITFFLLEEQFEIIKDKGHAKKRKTRIRRFSMFRHLKYWHPAPSKPTNT